MLKSITFAAALIAATPALSMTPRESEAVGLYFQSMSNCGENVVGLSDNQKSALASLMMKAIDSHPQSFTKGQDRANKNFSRKENCDFAVKAGGHLPK